MPSFNESAPEPSEGWGAVLRPSGQVTHYYRGAGSLCGRAGSYAGSGSLEPDENHMSDDCPECRKVLDEEAMEQGFPGPGTEAQMIEDSRNERDL